MTETQLLRRVRDKIRAPWPLYKAMHRREEWFECPICAYIGPFATANSFAGSRKYAIYPRCNGLERHRLQYFVVSKALRSFTGNVKMLHFAPEKVLPPDIFQAIR